MFDPASERELDIEIREMVKSRHRSHVLELMVKKWHCRLGAQLLTFGQQATISR
jgi:hypothetical protein